MLSLGIGQNMPIASALKSVAELAVGPFGSVGHSIIIYLSAAFHLRKVLQMSLYPFIRHGKKVADRHKAGTGEGAPWRLVR